MIRMCAIGLAVALAVAVVPDRSQTAYAAEAKTGKTKAQRGSSGFTPDQATTMTAIALAESRKKKGKRAPPTVTLKRGNTK